MMQRAPYVVRSDGQRVTEPQRELPVARRVEVLVVGGGTAGVAAALAAARAGAETLLIERSGYVGGTGTGALMSLYSYPYEHIHGICRELINSMVDQGGAALGLVIPFDPECFKQVALAKLGTAGVGLMLYTWTADAIVEAGRVRGVVVEGKSGRQAVLADVVIDASGDADVAARAGARCVAGREEDRKMRPMTVLFKMGPIDVQRIAAYRAEHPEEFAPDPGHNVLDLERRIVRLDGFFTLMKEGREIGQIDPNIHYLRLHGLSGPQGNLYVNSVRVYGVDGTRSEDLTRAQQEGMRQVSQLVRFLRASVPGFERAELLETAASMGVRETRRIVGDYTLTIADCGSHRRFPDALVSAVAHMVPGVEIHNPDGNEGAPDDPYLRELVLPFNEFSIPLRCLLPQALEGLLVAGRCLSATHEADGWTRGQVVVMHTAEAAGIAAALAAREQVTPRRLNLATLHAALRAAGVRFFLPD
jgi:hypothetical protein